MPSAAKLAANRLNAQRSTGPTTREGKARSAQNASTHYAFCGAVVLPGEDQLRFRAMRQSLLASLNPQNSAEFFLADRAVALAWRLDRCQFTEYALDQDCRLAYERGIAKYKRSHDTTDLDPDEAASLDADRVPAALLLAEVYSRPDPDRNPFERLARAELRLHGMLNTTLRRLQALQSYRHRQQTGDVPADPPSPYLDDAEHLDVNADDDATATRELQNEPTDDDHQPPPAGVPTSVGHASPRPDPQPSKLQNEPTARPPSSNSFAPSSLRGSTTPRNNPRSTQALYQAATRAAADLLPPPVPTPPNS
jgi:hypothetical protein